MDGTNYIYPVNEVDSERFAKYFQTQKEGQFIIPIPSPSSTDSYLVSRFLAKVGLEVLTHKVIKVAGWEKDAIFRTELDELRNYARYGNVKRIWEYHERRIYTENHRFSANEGELYEVLHEFDTLYTEKQELFVVVAILGVEYTINLCDPEIQSYLNWLERNQYKSPLYLNDSDKLNI